jgi:hypothetical protein
LSKGSQWAATIMVAVASEAAIRALIETFAESIEDEGQRVTFRRGTARNIFRSFEHLQARLRSMRRELPPRLNDALDSTLSGVFDVIRLSRNDAGHPSEVPETTAASVHSRLILFLEYARHVAELSPWLAAHPR